MLDIKLDNKLFYIAIGLRFRPNFIVEDKLGEIIDRVLYSQQNLFDKYAFNMQNGDGIRKLINANGTVALIINSQNIILEIKDTDKYNYTDVEKFFEEKILNEIIQRYKILNIDRIGYVKRYKFVGKQILDVFDKKFNIENSSDFNIHFSKKYPTSQSEIKRDINDYFNYIYDLAKFPNTEELVVSLDSQKYFNPYIDYDDFCAEKEYRIFIEKVTDYNKNKFIKWLNNYCGEQIYDTK